MSSAEKPVRSPCVSVCALNEDNLCIGCYRSADEITRWVKMSSEQRLAVLELCRERARLNNPFA